MKSTLSARGQITIPKKIRVRLEQGVEIGTDAWAYNFETKTQVTFKQPVEGEDWLIPVYLLPVFDKKERTDWKIRGREDDELAKAISSEEEQTPPVPSVPSGNNSP